jgi:nucleotide-binding universal stress UspA family protein
MRRPGGRRVQAGSGARPRFVDPGDLVLKLGRPMPLAEATGGEVLGEKVVIGWKDTREARRTIVDALPFLEQAREVFVGLVEERDYAAEWTSLKDVLHWLERHRSKARAAIVPSAGSPAETIMSTAASMGADLVVTGAYGHSRLPPLSRKDSISVGGGPR